MQKKRISAFFIISLCIFLPCLIALVLSKYSTAVADTLNETVCYAYRLVMAKFGDIFPFSLFEIIIICLPAIIALIVFLAVRMFKRGEGRVRFILNLAGSILIIYSGYILGLGIGYNTTTVAEKMQIEEVEVTRENLAEVMTLLRDEVNTLAEQLSANEDGTSSAECTFSDISEKICISYDNFYRENGFPKTFTSHAKSVYFGNVMSYLGLGGIYTFYTGEANANSAYPIYDMTFTAAHELSHQRGILRENEANFMAYLVLSESDDPYLRYSAALNMYQYIASALYRTDKELYYAISSELCDLAKTDINTSNSVTRKYGDTFIADISSFINDLYLKSNGTDGVVTYGRVVTLTVSYFEMNK